MTAGVPPGFAPRHEIPRRQQYAHLNHKQDRVQMQKVHIDGVFKHKLQQTVGDQMKADDHLGPQGRHAQAEQSDNDNGYNRNVIKTCKDTNHLPQTVRCKLQQGCHHERK